jgi:hypothetical protein
VHRKKKERRRARERSLVNLRNAVSRR